MSYAVKLRKSGKDHLIFLNGLLERPDIPKNDSKAEFEWAKRLVLEHRSKCKGCTKEAIKAVKQGFKDLATSKPQ